MPEFRARFVVVGGVNESSVEIVVEVEAAHEHEAERRAADVIRALDKPEVSVKIRRKSLTLLGQHGRTLSVDRRLRP